MTSTLESDNTVTFDPPYGEAKLLLALRRGPDGEEQLLVIRSGQFECSEECPIEAKFDGGKVQKFWAHRGNDTVRDLPVQR